MTTISRVEKPGFFKRTHEVLTEGSYKSYKILFFISALVILCIASLVIILRRDTTLGEFIEGVSVESVGMLFDILILGFIFHYFSNKGEKKKELEREEREKQLKIERYLEEIDDYRRWDEKEAMFRIVGNIKRLIKLEQTNLNLSDCYLQNSNLYKADLQGANLRGVNLQWANLQRANLWWADLQRADLYKANLQGAMLYNAYLRGADLPQTYLHQADLQGAMLNKANLGGADLRRANLQEADLQEAKGLTVEMLLEVKTLYKVKGLDPELENKLKAQRPELFEEPKE